MSDTPEWLEELVSEMNKQRLIELRTLREELAPVIQRLAEVTDKLDLILGMAMKPRYGVSDGTSRVRIPS